MEYLIDDNMEEYFLESDEYSVESDEEFNTNMETWRKCTTYQQIVDLQLKYLNGEISMAPYCYCEDDIDIKSIKDTLVQINQKKFLITSVRDGYDKNNNIRYYMSRIGNYSNGYGHAYLTGAMDKKITWRFIIELLENYGDIYFVIVNNVVLGRNTIIASFNENKLICYRRWKQNNKSIDLKNDVLLDNHCTYSIINDIPLEQYPSQINIHTNKPFFLELDVCENLIKILSITCDDVDIICIKPGISKIVEHTNDILDLIQVDYRKLFKDCFAYRV